MGESTMAMVEYQAMVLLETVEIMAMEVDMVGSMVVDMVVTMASVKLTVMLMPTPSDRLPMDSLRLMPMPLVTPTMLESLLESTMAMVEYQAMVLLETVDIMAMEVDMVVSMVVDMMVTMASVKLTVMLMPTPSDRLPMDSLRLMPMPLVTPTMLESLLEST